MKQFLAASALCTTLLAMPTAYAGTLSDTDLMALQVTMQSHIDASLVDGAMLYMDPETGNVMHYYPTKAHPKVMSLGDNFVMCAEVVDDMNKASMANFYITRSGAHFVVFQTTVGTDPTLQKLMKDGRATMAN